MTNKGVTLIELLIVIVVLGIISAFSVVAVGEIIKNTKIKADLNNLDTLNQATENYVNRDNITTTDVFEGIDTDYYRIDSLLSLGYIDQRITPQQEDASFGWNVDTQQWQLFVSGNPYNRYDTYDFSTMTLDDAILDGLTVPSSNLVEYDETNGVITLLNQSGMLLKETSSDEYSFSVTISTQNTSDTRPVFFFDYNDAADDLSKGEGFAILFNRNSAFVRIFKITNGTSYTQSTTFYYSSTGVIPTVATDASWYAGIHTFSFNVTRVNTSTKQMDITVDGQFLKSFTYTKSATSDAVYYGPNVRGSGSEIYIHEFN